MAKKEHPPKEAPSQPVVDPDASGQLEALANLEELAPLAPLLKKSVEHMKRGNSHQIETNAELSKLNVAQARQQKVTWVTNGLICLILGGFGFGIYELHTLRGELEGTRYELSKVAKALTKVGTDTESTKKALEEQPKITVKPDPTTSAPVLVVEQPPSSASSEPSSEPTTPKPKGDRFEFKIEPLKEEDPKK